RRSSDLWPFSVPSSSRIPLTRAPPKSTVLFSASNHQQEAHRGGSGEAPVRGWFARRLVVGLRQSLARPSRCCRSPSGGAAQPVRSNYASAVGKCSQDGFVLFGDSCINSSAG